MLIFCELPLPERPVSRDSVAWMAGELAQQLQPLAMPTEIDEVEGDPPIVPQAEASPCAAPSKPGLVSNSWFACKLASSTQKVPGVLACTTIQADCAGVGMTKS